MRTICFIFSKNVQTIYLFFFFFGLGEGVTSKGSHCLSPSYVEHMECLRSRFAGIYMTVIGNFLVLLSGQCSHLEFDRSKS